MSSTLYDGWVPHTAPYSTPPTITGGAYYFGLNYEDKSPPIDSQLTRDIQEIEKYSQYYPSLSASNKPGDQISAKFIPVNGIFNHWFFGKAAAISGGYTITNMDGSAYKPRIGAFSQSGTKKIFDYGLVFGSLNLEYANQRFGVSMQGKSIGHGSTTSNPSGYTYPSSISTPFDHLASMTWDGDTVLPSRFSGQFMQNLQPFIGSNGLNQAISEFTIQKGAYNLQFVSDYGELLVTDYEDGSLKAFIYKVAKAADPTKYLQYTHNCMIKSLIPTRVYGEEIIWSAVLAVEDTSVEIKDGTTGFYGT